MKKKILFHSIKKELKQFEKFYEDYVQDLEYATYLIDSKGKMIRPALTLIAAKMYGKVSEATLWAALSIELMHNATLVHDDVVDNADLRRDRDTFRAKQGDKHAVLYGDYLLAKSLECVAKTGDIRIVDIIARTTAEMSIGEIDQLNASGLLETSEREYLDIIYKKTATLFVSSLLAGYYTTCQECDNVDLIWSIGYNLGLVFQMKDDVIDYERHTDSGKQYGNDVKEQKLTLPLIYALSQADDATKENIKTHIGLAEDSRESLNTVIDFVVDNGGITHTEKVIADYKQRAQDAISQLPDGEIKDMLSRLSDYIIQRKR